MAAGEHVGSPAGSRSDVRHQAAVLGYPIGHSLSPALHRAAYRSLGLTGWSYRAMECTEERFTGWFTGLRTGTDPDVAQWAGLSLTMPLKQVVLPLLDVVSDLARATGSVNTVTWDAEGRSHGENTDVHGVVAALETAGVSTVRTGCVLGSGATASSAVVGLGRLGCSELTVLARSAGKARPLLDLAASLGISGRHAGLEAHDEVWAADAVVCTLPAEVSGDWATALGRDRRHTGAPDGALLDVTYHPWPPVAVQSWEKLGGTAIGGFEMLLQQAGEQVRLMTGLTAPLADMRSAELLLKT